MNAHDLLRQNIDFTHGITKAYLSDLTDDDLLVRAIPGSNHIAWQLGHLVVSERSFLETLGASVPDLPEDFAQKHGRDNTESDDPGDFCTKAEYLSLMASMHDAAKATIDATDAEALDAPSPERMRSFFPTVGSMLMMTGSHEMMHTGQIAAIRRKLGKPVVI